MRSSTEHFHSTGIFIPQINNRSHCWKWFPLSVLRVVIFGDDFNCLLFSFLSVTEFGHQPDPRQGVLKDMWDKHAWIWDKGEPSLLESGFHNQRQHLTCPNLVTITPRLPELQPEQGLCMETCPLLATSQLAAHIHWSGMGQTQMRRVWRRMIKQFLKQMSFFKPEGRNDCTNYANGCWNRVLEWVNRRLFLRACEKTPREQDKSLITSAPPQHPPMLSCLSQVW